MPHYQHLIRILPLLSGNRDPRCKLALSPPNRARSLKMALTYRYRDEVGKKGGARDYNKRSFNVDDKHDRAGAGIHKNKNACNAATP